MEKKNYIHGICICYKALFGNDKKILSLSKKDPKEKDFFRLLVSFHHYEHYTIYFALQAIDFEINNLEIFLLAFKKEIKHFLDFQKYEYLSTNLDYFNEFLVKISKRMEYYFDIFFSGVEDLSNYSIFSLFKILKACSLRYIPNFCLPESIREEINTIFSKIFEAIYDEMELFSSFPPIILPLGVYFSKRGIVLYSSLENKMAYLLSSFNEFISKINNKFHLI